MKTIILYATKYGAAREIAKLIAGKISEASVFNLKEDTIPPLSQFDCVIIGGPLYAGMLRKEAKKFVELNAAELSDKKLGLFLSGLGTEQAKDLACFNGNFPEEILKKAKAKAFLGGIYDPSKAGWLERAVLKTITKQSSYINCISEDKIDKFIEELMS